MKKCAVVSVFFLYAVCLFWATAAPVSAKTVNLSYATFRPPTDVYADPWLNAMGRELEEKSQGVIKFKVHWASALGAGKDQFMMVKDGVVDMTDFPGSWMPGKFTLSEVANLPMAATQAANMIKVMNALTAKGYFEKQWGEVEILTFSATPPYKFIFRKAQPMTVDGLKGLKVRTPGGYVSEYLLALGMLPVNVAPSDAYMAWQTGVVDAWTNPPGALIKFKFHELPTKALLDADLQTFGNAAVIINKKKFSSLSADLQQIIRDVTLKYIFVYAELGHQTDADALVTATKAGIEIYQMPPAEMAKMKAAAKPIWEKYIGDMEAKGLPGRDLVAEFAATLRQLGENPPY